MKGNCLVCAHLDWVGGEAAMTAAFSAHSNDPA